LGEQEAAERYWEFQAGVYADPIFKGDYPASVKLRVPSTILPRITPELKKDLLNSVDYYAMNHYTAM
jgi:beta-glucosidase